MAHQQRTFPLVKPPIGASSYSATRHGTGGGPQVWPVGSAIPVARGDNEEGWVAWSVQLGRDRPEQPTARGSSILHNPLAEASCEASSPCFPDVEVAEGARSAAGAQARPPSCGKPLPTPLATPAPHGTPASKTATPSTSSGVKVQNAEVAFSQRQRQKVDRIVTGAPETPYTRSLDEHAVELTAGERHKRRQLDAVRREMLERRHDIFVRFSSPSSARRESPPKRVSPVPSGAAPRTRTTPPPPPTHSSAQQEPTTIHTSTPKLRPPHESFHEAASLINAEEELSSTLSNAQKAATADPYSRSVSLGVVEISQTTLMSPQRPQLPRTPTLVAASCSSCLSACLPPPRKWKSFEQFVQENAAVPAPKHSRKHHAAEQQRNEFAAVV